MAAAAPPQDHTKFEADTAKLPPEIDLALPRTKSNLPRDNSDEDGSTDNSGSWEEVEDLVAHPSTGIAEPNELDEEDGWVADPNNPAEMTRWSGKASIRGNSEAMRMILLNFSTIGITFTWGVEMTYCTPYLLSLGLSKSMTSLVWIAGPLSGLMVQPIVGAIADESRSKWGRRRPFIVVGALVVALCLLTLGWTKEIVGIFIRNEETARIPTITLAVLSIYAVDFSINAVMSAARSLMVDTLPIDKQQDGAAWGGRISAIGHLIEYVAGAADLSLIFGGYLGDTQFKKLIVIAIVMILGSCAVTSWAVTERALVGVRHDPRNSGGTFKFVYKIWTTLRNLPPRIQAICWAQFWAWIGWFPFLFYNSTWVGETYFRYDAPAAEKNSKDALGQIGRIGSTALVIYSVITFIGAWLLPLMVRNPKDDVYTPRPPPRLAPVVQTFNKYKPDLLTTWMLAHGMFACAMYLAPFAHSFRTATILICICGLPWTVAMWAPTTFLGIEVNKLSGATEPSGSYRPLSAGSVEMTNLNGAPSPQLEHGLVDDDDDLAKSNTSGELSGIYFGILNIYTTLPQFVGTFISTIVFTVLEPGKSPELAEGGKAGGEPPVATTGPNAISVCLFIGAMSATVAIFVTRRLRYL